MLTILSILILNLVLGVSLNLKVPYTSAVKYDYQALPFFCLAAASLVAKFNSLFALAKTKIKLNKAIIFSLAFGALILMGAAIFADVYYAHQLSTSSYLIFKVEMNQDVGYSLFNSTLLSQGSLQFNIQYLGYAIMLSGLLWLIRDRILRVLKGIQ